MGASNSKNSCPAAPLDEDATLPAVGSMKFYGFNLIFSGACMILTLIVMFFVMHKHATHLSKPKEQLKILRIAFLIPTYSIIAHFCVHVPVATIYLAPWLDLVLAIALSSFFELMCEYIAPDGPGRDAFFAELFSPNRKSSSKKGNGLARFRRAWIMVFQYPVVTFFIAILTDITQAAGVYCNFHMEPYFAKLWLTIVTKTSLMLSLLTILFFYRRVQTHLVGHRPLAKLFAFKIVVLVSFVQTMVFLILQAATNVLNGTPTMTYADLNLGIPNLITCIVLVPISIFFIWAYPWSPYVLPSAGHQRLVVEVGHADGLAARQEEEYLPSSYQGGRLGLRAWLEMINPSELIQAIVLAGRMLIGAQSQVNDTRGYNYKDVEPSLASSQGYPPLSSAQREPQGMEYQGYQMGGQ